MQIVNAVKAGIKYGHIVDEIQEKKHLLRSFKIEHAKRDANLAADALDLEV